MTQKKNILCYLILSFAAAILLIALTLFGSADIKTIDIYDKLFVSAIFIIICVFGISLAFYPRWYKRIKILKKQIEGKQQNQETTMSRNGHHPDCNQFQSHIIKIKNKTFCAGCFGLALGSVISVFLMIIYAISVDFSIFKSHYMLILGLLIIFLIFVEIVSSIRRSIIHLVSNALLVISFLLISISIFELTGSIIYTSIAVILTFLFLDTRVQLSYFNHSLICKKCKKKCKMY